MKAARVKRFASKYLMPHMPGFVVQGHLLYAKPVDYLLRGFCFDSSGFDADAVYLQAFVQPIYQPLTYVAYIFGNRIGSYDINDGNEAVVMREMLDAIVRKGLPFLKKLWEPEDIVREAKNFTLDTNPYVKEARTGALVLCGDYRAAAAQNSDLIRCMEKAILENPKIAWYCPILDRAVLLADLLKTDPNAARAKLDEYSNYTLNALRMK